MTTPRSLLFGRTFIQFEGDALQRRLEALDYVAGYYGISNAFFFRFALLCFQLPQFLFYARVQFAQLAAPIVSIWHMLLFLS